MEPADTLETSERAHPELIAAWTEFFGSVRRARGRAARNDGELSLPQYHLLAALSTLPQARCGELAEAAGVAASTASRMLDTLAREGLVERGEAPGDRRAVQIALTERGTGELARKRAEVEAKLARMFGALSAEERAGAERLLLRLAVLIDEL